MPKNSAGISCARKYFGTFYLNAKLASLTNVIYNRGILMCSSEFICLHQGPTYQIISK